MYVPDAFLSLSRLSYSLLQVVLIHGLSVPAIIWKDIAPRLVEKGFRVLMYG